MRYTASPFTSTPTFSSVTWSAQNDSLAIEVGTMVTLSLGHLKQLRPWPARRTRAQTGHPVSASPSRNSKYSGILGYSSERAGL